MEIRDSVAIVTGSSRGIGLAIASMLAEEGGRVAINASRESDTLHRVAKALGPEDRVIATAGDVGDFEACRKIVDTTVDRFGRIDILVNNAGIFGLKRTVDMEPRDWETIFRVHVFGAFNMIRHVLPRMTLEHLQTTDSRGEIFTWLRTIQTLLGR